MVGMGVGRCEVGGVLGVCWSGVPQRLVELGRREEGVWRGFAIACRFIFSGPEGFVELMSVLLRYQVGFD